MVSIDRLVIFKLHISQTPPTQARYADLTFSRLPDGSGAMRTPRAQAEVDKAWEALAQRVSSWEEVVKGREGRWDEATLRMTAMGEALVH